MALLIDPKNLTYVSQEYNSGQLQNLQANPVNSAQDIEEVKLLMTGEWSISAFEDSEFSSDTEYMPFNAQQVQIWK